MPGVSHHPLSATGQLPGRSDSQWGPICLHPANRHAQHAQEHGNTLTHTGLHTTFITDTLQLHEIRFKNH